MRALFISPRVSTFHSAQRELVSKVTTTQKGDTLVISGLGKVSWQ